MSILPRNLQPLVLPKARWPQTFATGVLFGPSPGLLLPNNSGAVTDTLCLQPSFRLFYSTWKFHKFTPGSSLILCTEP